MLIIELQKKELIKPPSFLGTNTHYLTIMGSHAYGAVDTNAFRNSDLDIYGFCIPPKEIVFPHLNNEILGFGKQKKRFEQWSEHHILDKDAKAGKGQEYDFSIYNIVKFFQLLMENNPNIIDSIFTPTTCVMHCTQVGNMVRDNRRMFLHKGCWHKFRGYAYAQQAKMNNMRKEKELVEFLKMEQDFVIDHKTTFQQASDRSNFGQLDDGDWNKYYTTYKEMVEKSKRFENVKIMGFDTKYALHLVRLLLECEQILIERDIDFSRNSEVLKSIRRGEWTVEKIQDWFSMKEKQLEELYAKSTIPNNPDEEAIKTLLLNCLEHHYGNLKGCIVTADKYKDALSKIRSIVEEAGVF